MLIKRITDKRGNLDAILTSEQPSSAHMAKAATEFGCPVTQLFSTKVKKEGSNWKFVILEGEPPEEW